jgi:hypothetical protein
VSRRRFLAATGSLLATSPAARAISGLGAEAPSVPPATPAAAAKSQRKIPIGVFISVYSTLPLDVALDKVTALGLEAVEVGTGGYVGNPHCPVDELLADSAKARAWKKKFEDRNILIGALSCHGNPLHPDSNFAQRDAEALRRSILLA